MRSVILIMLFSILCNGLLAQTNNMADSALLIKISKINFEEFHEKKSVRRFMKEIGVPYKTIFFLDEPACMLYGVYFVLTDNTSVKILIRKFRHVERFSETCKWDINKLKREKIFRIRVEYKDSCYKGCNFNQFPINPITDGNVPK